MRLDFELQKKSIADFMCRQGVSFTSFLAILLVGKKKRILKAIEIQSEET
jgi:hypothetical protein